MSTLVAVDPGEASFEGAAEDVAGLPRDRIGAQELSLGDTRRQWPRIWFLVVIRQ